MPKGNSDKRIIYIESDDSVCIITPADNTHLTVEQIQDKDVPPGKVSYIVDKHVIPTDRSFRDAWTYSPYDD